MTLHHSGGGRGWHCKNREICNSMRDTDRRMQLWLEPLGEQRRSFCSKSLYKNHVKVAVERPAGYQCLPCWYQSLNDAFCSKKSILFPRNARVSGDVCCHLLLTSTTPDKSQHCLFHPDRVGKGQVSFFFISPNFREDFSISPFLWMQTAAVQSGYQSCCLVHCRSDRRGEAVA